MKETKIKPKFSFYLLVLSLVICSCNTSSRSTSLRQNSTIINSALPPAGKYGACYAKYISKDIYEIRTEEYPIYENAYSTENGQIESKTIVITPAISKWVKKIKYEGCVSANPNECYIACLEETPSETRTITVVKDTVNFKDFKLEKIDQNILVKKGGDEGWIEIVCQNQFTTKFIKKLQLALQENGHYAGPISGKLTNEIRNSLKAYQIANNLIVGYYDIESMKKLGL